ncbi:MAG TPA: hypothetical protein VLK85_00100 [Ramlibacter sp.]|nr:hypothetical protein [Ramlibacter sp.]
MNLDEVLKAAHRAKEAGPTRVVLTDDGTPVAVQWALGDHEAVLAPFSGEAPQNPP